MLQISHLYADYGGKPALEDINLTLESGELLVVLGPSGCGKTTLLNLIAGFVHYQQGSIQLAGKRIEGPGAERGVKSVQQVRVRAAQSLGASRTQVLWFVILPGALPEILTGLRIGLGVGWSTLVAAELIAATRGLGFMVQSAGEFLATDVVLAGIAVIAIIAFLLELGLRALQRRLTPWHGEVQ